MNLTSGSLVGAGPELEDLPEHLPRDDDRGRPAARPAVEEGAEDAVAPRRRNLTPPFRAHILINFQVKTST